MRRCFRVELVGWAIAALFAAACGEPADDTAEDLRPGGCRSTAPVLVVRQARKYAGTMGPGGERARGVIALGGVEAVRGEAEQGRHRRNRGRQAQAEQGEAVQGEAQAGRHRRNRGRHRRNRGRHRRYRAPQD